ARRLLHGRQFRLRPHPLRGAGEVRRAHPRPLRAGRTEGAPLGHRGGALRRDGGDRGIGKTRTHGALADTRHARPAQRGDARVTEGQDPNTLDAAALAPYLERHVPGFSGLEAIEKFPSGQSNPTYLLKAKSGRYVLRAKPPGKLLKSAHQVDREFRVMKALAETAVPVPRVLHLSEEESPIGRMFYVMEHVKGRVFWDPALPDISGNSERAAIYDAMNATLATLHDVDLEKAGLADFGRPGSYFERQLSRWTGQYRASETETVKAMDRLIAWPGAN